MLNRGGDMGATVFKGSLISVAMILGFGAAAMAQNRGTITGRATDETGAVIPGVSIKITNANTGIGREAVTNETGTYTVELLPAGQYRVEAELPGFKKEIHSGITLNVGQTARIDLLLRIGEVTDVVDVTGEAPLVQTEDSSLGAVIDDRKVVDLPLNGRDFSALTYLIPGAFRPIQGSNLGYRGGFTVGGSDETTNQFILDGITNNGTGTMEIAGHIDIDALQEFKIQTSTYSAQYGRFAGAQVNAVTKSGTNTPHGSAYLFHRNDNLDARNFFDPWPLENLPEFRRHQYGGTFGGPIKKNRTFYFGSYQGQRQARFLTRTASVPLPEFFTGDLSARRIMIIDPQTGQPFPNSQIPSTRIWPGATTLSQFWPTPQQVVGTAGIATSLLPEPNNFHQFSVKFDHQLSQKHSIAASHTYYHLKSIEYENAGNPRIPGFAADHKLVSQSTSISLISAFTPTLINEFRAGQSRLRRGRYVEIKRDFNAVLGIRGTTADTEEVARGVPRFNVTGFESIGDAANIPSPRGDQTFSWIDIVSFQKGAHSFKTGVDIYRQQMNLIFPQNGRGTFDFTGLHTGDAFADFLLGLPFRSSRNASQGHVDSHPRKASFNAFFQDDWKATTNLTLNLGVRYELNTAVVEKYNQLSSFDRATLGMRVATANDRHVYNGDHNNFAPRIGFAWRPLGTTALVLRGGYGLFFNINNIEFNNLYLLNPPFFKTDLFQAVARTAVISMVDPFPTQLGSSSANPAGIDPNFQTAYLQHWTFGFQRELGGSIMVDLSYEGKKGTKLQRADWNINQPVPPVTSAALRDSRRPYPSIGNIRWRDSGGSSIYHAAQLRLEKRFSRGLSFISGYTFGKMIDNVGSFQNAYDQRADRGLSDYDNRHRFQFSYIYELPIGNGRAFLGSAQGWKDKIANGWQLSGIAIARSGQFFTPTWSGDIANVGAASVRPNVVGDWRVSKPTPELWWNPAAFAAPAPGTFGNAGRAILEGPGLFNIDFSLIKNTRFAENKNLQLRFEFFNALNHPNFDIPDRSVNGGRFGRIFTANEGRAGREVQLGMKYVF
jgi:hypothetical protein